MVLNGGTMSWRTTTGRWRDWVWRGWRSRYAFLPGPEGEAGEGRTPVLLIHGFGASVGHWRHNMAVIAAQRPVYALDLVGFGASSKPPTGAYDAYFWADQVFEFWRQMLGRPVAIVGNSIGSLVALTAADRHPAMAAAVVAISLPDPAAREDLIPKAVMPLVNAIERLVAAPWLLKTIFYGVRRPAVVRRWAGVAYCDHAAIDGDLVEILSAPARDRGAADAFAQIIRTMSSPRFGPKMRDLLPRLEIPVLILWGDGDRMIPPQLAQQMGQWSDRAEVRMLPGLGHCPHDEAPDQINPLLQTWFAQLDSRDLSQTTK